MSKRTANMMKIVLSLQVSQFVWVRLLYFTCLVPCLGTLIPTSSCNQMKCLLFLFHLPQQGSEMKVVTGGKEPGPIQSHLLVPHINKLPLPEDYTLQELRQLARSCLVELTSWCVSITVTGSHWRELKHSHLLPRLVPRYLSPLTDALHMSACSFTFMVEVVHAIWCKCSYAMWLN